MIKLIICISKKFCFLKKKQQLTSISSIRNIAILERYLGKSSFYFFHTFDAEKKFSYNNNKSKLLMENQITCRDVESFDLHEKNKVLNQSGKSLSDENEHELNGWKASEELRKESTKIENTEKSETFQKKCLSEEQNLNSSSYTFCEEKYSTERDRNNYCEIERGDLKKEGEINVEKLRGKSFFVKVVEEEKKRLRFEKLNITKLKEEKNNFIQTKSENEVKEILAKRNCDESPKDGDETKSVNETGENMILQESCTTSASSYSCTADAPVPSSALPPIHKISSPRVMPSQRLYVATKEDVEILSQSSLKYPHPIEVEGGVIIRLVRLCDPVTSPVGRVIRNRQFGIRDNERWMILVWGILFSSSLVMLCIWQLRRMKWKKALIEFRTSNLRKPKIVVDSSPFIWSSKESEEKAEKFAEGANKVDTACGSIGRKADDNSGSTNKIGSTAKAIHADDKVSEYEYRVVEAHGVLDVTKELRVGPRPSLHPGGRAGYLIVNPLILKDGSTILVNRGHCPYEYCGVRNGDGASVRNEIPEHVTVRGVLERKEITNSATFSGWIKLKNKPQENYFAFLDAKDLGSVVGASNVDECKAALISAYDILYDEDVYMKKDLQNKNIPNPSAYLRKRFDKFVMKQKPDYLLFYADEHTHFNYAVQWALMAMLTFGMTIYKFVEVSRWKF